MTDALRAQLAHGMVQAKRLVGLADWSIAEELAALHKGEGWKALPYPQGYTKNGVDVSGKRPSTWRGFLEGLAWETREQGGDASAGHLWTLVHIYEWAAGLGLPKEFMAVLGYEPLKALWRLHGKDDRETARRAIEDAYTQLQTEGTIRLADYRPGGTPAYAIETEEDGEFYTVKSLNVTVDGATYRNRIPKRLIHLLCKRMRAANIVRNA
jgi:hypothetical protein